jgi:hypothetical protein
MAGLSRKLPRSWQMTRSVSIHRFVASVRAFLTIEIIFSSRPMTECWNSTATVSNWWLSGSIQSPNWPLTTSALKSQNWWSPGWLPGWLNYAHPWYSIRICSVMRILESIGRFWRVPPIVSRKWSLLKRQLAWVDSRVLFVAMNKTSWILQENITMQPKPNASTTTSLIW